MAEQERKRVEELSRQVEEYTEALVRMIKSEMALEIERLRLTREVEEVRGQRCRKDDGEWCTEAITRLTRERDAYKKAKAENDDRFMRERGEAQAECEEIARLADKAEAEVKRLRAVAVAASEVVCDCSTGLYRDSGGVLQELPPCGECAHCTLSRAIAAAGDGTPIQPEEVPKPLTPVDTARCQAERGGAFTMGPGLTRCSASPERVVREATADQYGRRGAMSLCADCLSVFSERERLSNYQIFSMESWAEICTG